MKVFRKISSWLMVAMVFATAVHAEEISFPYKLKKPTPTVTPTPRPTPTFIQMPTSILQVIPSFSSENRSILHPFSMASAEENGVSIQSAGFGTYPQADVSFGYLPVDNAFEGATDGQGIIIQADPGAGVMIAAEKIEDKQSAMIRCSVRADRPHALVTIASIGSAPDRFIAVNYPEYEAYFTNQYLRLQTFCVPPAAGFQPIIQVVNTSKTESLTVYLDNFDIYFIDPNKYYSGNFLDGDESDPPIDQISLLTKSESAATVWSYEPTMPKDFKMEPDGHNTQIKGTWSWDGIDCGILDTLYIERAVDSTCTSWNTVYASWCLFYPTECMDWRLTPDTIYYYRLRIRNITGKENWTDTYMVRTNP